MRPRQTEARTEACTAVRDGLSTNSSRGPHQELIWASVLGLIAAFTCTKTSVINEAPCLSAGTDEVLQRFLKTDTEMKKVGEYERNIKVDLINLRLDPLT